LSGQAVTERTSLSELFELWIEAKELVDGVSEQTAQAYREVWRVHGAQQLGALRVTEPTSRANAHLQQMGSTTQAKRLRMILAGMYGLAVRYDVLTVNPVREARTVKTEGKPARAASSAEFDRVRAAVRTYTNRKGLRPAAWPAASRLRRAPGGDRRAAERGVSASVERRRPVGGPADGDDHRHADRPRPHPWQTAASAGRPQG
jgi:hypothetical protein